MSDLEQRGAVIFKALKLITPEKARSLGIPAEACVFVSAVTKDKNVCRHCETDFTPLVYQVGNIITAQHFHEKSGGIYYYKSTSGIMHLSRWIAMVEPLGKQERLMSELNAFHSEQVIVRQIFARCGYPPMLNDSIHDLQRHSSRDPLRFLEQGFVSGKPYAELTPYCQQDDKPRFRFIARNGEVVFQPI